MQTREGLRTSALAEGSSAQSPGELGMFGVVWKKVGLGWWKNCGAVGRTPREVAVVGEILEEGNWGNWRVGVHH